VIEEFGAASGNRALNDTIVQDLKRAGYLSLSVTLAILLVAFGAVVAAGIPVLLALAGVLGTLGLAALVSAWCRKARRPPR
jgi:putative drug exporter of the RND superfamily